MTWAAVGVLSARCVPEGRWPPPGRPWRCPAMCLVCAPINDKQPRVKRGPRLPFFSASFPKVLDTPTDLWRWAWTRGCRRAVMGGEKHREQDEHAETVNNMSAPTSQRLL